MKIIFLEAVQVHGGARKSTIELAKRLIQHGHQALIVDFWGNCTEFINDVEESQIPLHILNKRNKPIAIFTSNNPVRIVGNAISFILNWIILKKGFLEFVKNQSPDIVIVNNSKTNSILQKNRGYRIVYFARGWFAYKSISFVDKIIYKNKSDFFIGVSQATRQAIYSGGFAPLERIFVVPNAIDLNIVNHYVGAKDVNETGSFVILHCGGFLPAKGHSLSVSLAERLKGQGIHYKMVLMGSVYDSPVSSEYLEKIRNRIISLGLEDNVEIILNQKDPYAIFKSANLLIHPSDTEGLPRVIMEAMAFGIPVIANSVGGVTDFVLNNFTGFITKHNDLNDYFEYTLKLYKNPMLYRKISGNAMNLILSNYMPENQLNEFEKVLAKM
jgi:glycosyltransferase involved in cell wall biosynthesis